MPQITLDYTSEKGQRILDAFKAHGLSSLIDPGTGQPYTELQLVKRGLIALVAREVYAFERGQAGTIAYTALLDVEESIQEDSDIAS